MNAQAEFDAPPRWNNRTEARERIKKRGNAHEAVAQFESQDIQELLGRRIAAEKGKK